MWTCSLFCFLFLLLLPQDGAVSVLGIVSVDQVNTTCKQCANKSPGINYDFCVTSIQAVSISHVTDLEGLAIIVMELGLGNASSTVSTIEGMLFSREFDPFAMRCLQDCLRLYLNAVLMVVNSITSLLSGQFDSAKTFMSTVMEATVTCEAGFKEKPGEVTPLTKENNDLYELSDIAICIVNLVSSMSPSVKHHFT